MHKILIDTCVWLDMAKDHRQRTLLSVIEELVKTKIIELIVPRVVIGEFVRNKSKVSKETRDSSKSVLKRAKEITEIYADKRQMRSLMHQLNDLEIRLPILSDSVNDSLTRIGKLLSDSTAIDVTDEITMRAAKRAIDRRVPFHHGKNQINDAIIIETYSDYIADKHIAGTRFAFVTHNHNDFSLSKGNRKLPHVDIEDLFSRVKSRYFINLGEAIKRIDPHMVSDLVLEYEWSTEPRTLTEILDNEHELCDKVWYNRHQNWKYKIETGRIKLVDKETFPVKDHSKRPMQRDVWAGALRAAAAKEMEYGIENLGPWDDFEWGMMNGKLSALRWVLGDDWDMLDT